MRLAAGLHLSRSDNEAKADEQMKHLWKQTHNTMTKSASNYLH